MKDTAHEFGPDGFKSNDAIVKAMEELGVELNKTRDEFERGLIVGRLSALNWGLGEPWDRSVVDVIATSSSRDDDAIREACAEFLDKVWYNSSTCYIWRKTLSRAAIKTGTIPVA